MISRLVCYGGCILLLLPMRPVHAQSPAADSARIDSTRSVLLSIPLRSPIRVLTVGRAIIEGRLSARSDTGIVIRQRRDSARASIARIAEIYRPARSLKSGAIVGGATGGVLGGLLLGTIAASFCERSDCSGAFGNGATIGVAWGGAVGALVGVGIGAFIHHWQRVWP